MAIDRYLAMTAAEIVSCAALPAKLGYMACHFSPYGTGLSNCPLSLPEGAMLILNDRIPPQWHDPPRVILQLLELVENLKCNSVLLDFEQLDAEASARLAAAIVDSLPCPVGVSASYARELDCPVFLPSVPCDTPLSAHLAPWNGREIWLETALDGQEMILTEDGAVTTPLPYSECPAHAHRDDALACHYQIHVGETLRFTLSRTREDLEELVERAEPLGITRTVGLWQELK